MQVEIENARELVESSGEGNRTDEAVYTEAIQQLETTLEAAAGFGLSAGSPVARAANQLISHLKVIS